MRHAQDWGHAVACPEAVHRTPVLTALAISVVLSACSSGDSATAPKALGPADATMAEAKAFTVNGTTYPTVSLLGSSPTLAVGAHETITAKLATPSATWMGTSIVWTSSNTKVASVTTQNWGVKSGDAAYLTGVAAGTATITGTTQSGTNSSFTVTVGASGASTAGPGASCPNAPSGYTTAWDDPWSAVPPASPTKGIDGFTNWMGNISVVADATAPKSAPSVLRMNFPKGSAGGGAPLEFGTTQLPANHGKIYVCIFMQISSNWSNNGNVGTKLLFFRTPYWGGSTGTNHYIGFDDSGTRSTHMHLFGGLQFGNGVASDFYPNTSSNNDLSGGAWHRIEALWVAESSGGAGNGSATMWLDGKVTNTYTGVSFFEKGETPSWTELDFVPTYGGGLNPVPWNQYFDMDDMYVSVE